METKKKAVAFVHNEIVFKALKEVLEKRGYDVRRDLEGCAGAQIGFVESYFALLGLLRQIRAVSPSLPFVLISNGEDRLPGGLEPQVYDVVRFDTHDEAEIRRGLLRWFMEGPGRVLPDGKSRI